MDQGSPALISQKAQSTAKRYRGEAARQYEANRAHKPKWQAEDRIVQEMLSGFPAGTQLIDIPCGTGRFFMFYALMNFHVAAFDINQAMLDEAAAKGPFDSIALYRGSIFEIPLMNDAAEVTLAIRIMNLIEESDMVKALGELQRVTRSQIILNVRTGDVRPGHFHSPQKIEAIEGALQPGWKIAENREIHEPDFRMLRLCNG